jgi:hypothetical protein
MIVKIGEKEDTSIMKNLPTIIEFFESPDFLDTRLSPAQSSIISNYYRNSGKFIELILITGMRGGKSMILTGILLYEFYRLLCIQKSYDGGLKSYFRERGILLGDDQRIYLTVAMENLDRAEATIFRMFRDRVQSLECFKSFMITDEGNRMAWGDIFVEAVTPESSTLVGRSIYLLLFDEICRNMDAAKFYQTLTKGTVTFKAERKIIVGSSPVYWNDFGMELLLSSDELYASDMTVEDIKLLAESDKYKNKVHSRLGYHLDTFEMNPQVTMDDPLVLGIKKSDPLSYKRDFLALPSELKPEKKCRKDCCHD